MLDCLKNIVFVFVIGFVFTWLVKWLGSDFLTRFYGQNLISLLVALFAINTATRSIIMSKLKEVAQKDGININATINELKKSVFEQLGLLILAVVVQILASSETLAKWAELRSFWTSVVSTAIFAYAIYIIYDTSNSSFIILDYENRKPENK